MILSYTIPDAQANKFIDTICAQYNYQAEFTDLLGNTSPNSETRGQFAKRMTAQILISVVKDFETRQALAGVAATITPITLT